MADYVLVDGDEVSFVKVFTPAIVDVLPGKIEGTGAGTLKGKKLCVAGDEKKVEVKGCPYKTPIHTIPGTGTLKILALHPQQKALKTKSGGKAVLLKGALFMAIFEVQTPAQQPPPGPGSPVPDPMKKYVGQGSFKTTNTVLKGS